MNPHINPAPMSRRDMLSRCGMGFGALALADLMKQTGLMDQTVARGGQLRLAAGAEAATLSGEGCATSFTFF